MGQGRLWGENNVNLVLMFEILKKHKLKIMLILFFKMWS